MFVGCGDAKKEEATNSVQEKVEEAAQEAAASIQEATEAVKEATEELKEEAQEAANKLLGEEEAKEGEAAENVEVVK